MLDLPTFSQMPLAMAVTCAFLCAVKSHTSVLFGRINCSAAGTSKELLGLSDHEVHGVRAFLHCDIRASLHDCWAQLLLCVCDAGFQGTVKCVLTWRLRRCHSCAECQNQVLWKRHLRMNQRLFSKRHLHIVKLSRNSCVMRV